VKKFEFHFLFEIGRKSGGMILACKESLENYIELLDIESKYVLWCKVSSKLVNLNEDVIFGNVYIPPEGYHQFLFLVNI
jgi:hypothetical protein